MIWGVDFGSKLAGTSVIATVIDGEIDLKQSAKKQDADDWLLENFKLNRPKLIFLDAPLSLPSVYKTGEGGSYFYRECDMELKCMSPMFLGGLTARAIKLATEFERLGTKVIETYPAAMARQLNLDLLRYKKDKNYLAEAIEIIVKKENLPLTICENWHQFDALLALASAFRFQNQRAKVYGLAQEGQIWI